LGQAIYDYGAIHELPYVGYVYYRVQMIGHNDEIIQIDI